MITGIDLVREGNKVIRTIVIGHKAMNGGVVVLKTIISVLPDWPTGHGQTKRK